VIVLDTNVLVYAVSEGHPLVGPGKRIFEALERGDVRATTTVDVIQEFVHVRGRRSGREDAAKLGRRLKTALSPLLVVGEDELDQGLRLFERHRDLDAFDAVLAAAALRHEADALVSADRAFAGVPKLRHVDPATPALDELLSA
jgi:uncharacterized protein